MSSGSGKKKLVAAAAPPPLSVSIAAAPIASETPTGGIKLLIDKNRIVSVPSTKTQHKVVQRQHPPVVIDYQNASLSQQSPASEDFLRIARANGGGGGGTTTLSFQPTTGTQKIFIKKVTPITSSTDIQGIAGGEMRVKVTGEDTNRNSNGQPMASGVGQLKQMNITNSLLRRRISVHRLMSIHTAQVPDTNNGQQTVTLSTKTVKLPDEQSLLKHKITSNNTPPQPSPTVPTTSTTNVSTVPVTASGLSRPANIVVNVTSAANPQINQGQGTVSLKNNPENGNDVSTATLAPVGPPVESVKGQTDSSVTVAFSANQTAQESSVGGFQLAASTEKGEDEKAQSKQPMTAQAANDEPTAATIIGTVLVEDDAVPKPSREMKSLQVMQAKSKILSEFITDTSSKGKLRKRRAGSTIDATVVESTDVDVSPTQAPRKRNRRRSTILLMDATDDNGKALAPDDSGKLEDLVNELPATRVRKIRSAKSEYALQKGDRSAESLSGGAKDFFSNLNLHQESNKTNNDQSSFPADPPKPGWDRFCWRCKKRDPDLGCNSCIRSYHKYCVRYTMEDPMWSCTECKMITNGTTDIESFTTCLGYLVKILLMQTNLNNSLNPINKSLMPHYEKYITRHIDLAVLNELQTQKVYKSSDEFFSDVGWIVHNMSIYPDNTILLKHARALQKRAKQEIEEMEPCYECYIKANTLCEDWFREPCSKPHLLVWAKMKGYPYWPGKLYVINANNQAFVRFFGAHDRSWMSVKECYLFSERDPNPPKQNLKSKLVLQYASSLEDIKHHIARLREQFNTFNYGSFMEAVDPTRLEEQQREMLPGAFLKKVKVTIKRSEGEMVAVASAACDEASQPPLDKSKSSVEEPERVSSPTSKLSAKKVATSSSRKRMTRRMSRILKMVDELPTPLANTESSQNLVASPSAFLVSNNDKAAEDKQTTAVAAESAGENVDDPDCDPKNLSLLLRRGSQSWETEPLSKRQKSGAEKGTLVNVAAKTTKATATSSNAKEKQQIVAVEEPVVEKKAIVPPPPDVMVDKAILASVAPTSTKKNSTATGLKAKEREQKETVEPVAEQAIMVIDKTILASVATTKTNSTAKALKTKEPPQAIAKDVAVDPVAGEVIIVSSNAPNQTPPGTLDKMMDTAVVNTVNVSQHSSIQTATEVQHPSHTLTTVANSFEAVVTATNTTKPCVDPLKSLVSVNVPTVCTTVAAAHSHAVSKATDATTSTVKTNPGPIAADDIKKEISSDDEIHIVECPKVALPAVPTAEAVRNDSSASLAPSTPSASTDVTKRQHITSPISSANAVKSVQQTPPAAVLSISSNTSVPTIKNNQRARKSFPGGASSNAKHVSAKQAASSLVHNVSLPTTITLSSASAQQTLTNPPQQPLITPMSATVSIPKELVAPSTVVSLIPNADAIASLNTSNASIVSNDNDDVMIIEEESIPSSGTSVASRGRKIDGNNQLPPPLVPKPPDTTISLLTTNDYSMEELNRTMQLFDDSSNRVVDHIRTVMEDLLKEMSANGSSLAELAALKLNQERQQEVWFREKEKQQHAFDNRLAELRVSLEQEKQRALNEQRQQLQREKQRAVQSTKMKQWCKKCFSEAHYYCCWNTSYCSAACQKKHWMEHQNDCTQDAANNARSVQASSTVTNTVVVATDSNSSSHNNSSSNNNSSSTSSHVRGRSSLQISAAPSYGGGGGDANNLPNKRSPNNRVFPSEITSTGTPLQTPVRFISGTMAGGNISYKTPIIQSVHGRDGMIINLPPHSSQNGGNVTLGVTTNMTTSTPQQLMQKRAAARDKSIQLNQQKMDNRNKGGYTARKTFDITASPYQSTNNNLLTSTIATIVPSATSTYATVTLADGVTVSAGSPGAWNQIAMLQSSGSHQLHSGTPFATASGAAGDGTEKGYSAVDLGIRQTHPTVTSLAQQLKTVQQQSSNAYMRHQQ